MEDVNVIIVDCSERPTSKVEILRGIITEKLTTAVREILAVVETTIVGYDKEVLLLRQELEDHKRQLDATLQPDVCPSSIQVKDEGNDKDNDEKPTLNDEEGAVVADILSRDYPSASSPINTDGRVQNVEIKKRKRHHPDTDPLDSAFEQQGAAQKIASQQNPGEPDFFNKLWNSIPELSVNPEFETILSTGNQSSEDQPATSDMGETKPEPTDKRNDRCVASGSAARNTQEFECKVCGIEFDSNGKLIEHARNHVNNPEVVCGVCGQHLETPEKLRSHMETHLKRWECEKCGRYFLTSFSFKVHSGVCQTGQQAPADDPLLGSSSHQIRKQGDSKCPFCDKSLKGRELEQHMMIHTGEKPFICTECGKTFRTQLNLKKHIQIHLGVKPLRCTQCDYRCSRSDHLKLHMNTHTGYKPYRCSLCDKAFTQSNSLKAHMKTHFPKLNE